MTVNFAKRIEMVEGQVCMWCGRLAGRPVARWQWHCNHCSRTQVPPVVLIEKAREGLQAVQIALDTLAREKASA